MIMDTAREQNALQTEAAAQRVRARVMLLLAVATLSTSTAIAGDPEFGQRIDRGLLAWNPITEASGLVASRQNDHVLWTHNDAGGGPTLFALGDDGRHLGVFHISGANARDWEDIAIGPGPDSGRSYLYIGDIGDNKAENNLKFIYRIAEPVVDINQAPLDSTLGGVETITFRYPAQNRDAETLLIDPLNKDLYVVSKREPNVLLFRAPYPQATTGTLTLEKVATLNLSGIVGGDISPAGDEILLKTLGSVSYWRRQPGQSLAQALETPPLDVPYEAEPQGEAICWDAGGLGYFTVSEEFLNIPAHLYYYPRLATSVAQPASPETFRLEQNYPNPFNPETSIVFFVDRDAVVELRLFDVLGREVAVLLRQRTAAGRHVVRLDATEFESGVYFYRLDLLDGTRASVTRKLLILK